MKPHARDAPLYALVDRRRFRIIGRATGSPVWQPAGGHALWPTCSRDTKFGVAASVRAIDSGVPAPRHILIYGPPAAGKLTVATRLAELYGLKVVDNHASVDPALRLFHFGTQQFGGLVEEIRVALIRSAARAGLDIVSTLVYGHGEDEAHVAKLTSATTDSGGEVYFVQLRPSDEVLEQRVGSASRVPTSKVSDVPTLRRMLAAWDLHTPIHAEDLRIDNSNLPVETVCELIAEAFGLQEGGAHDLTESR